MDLTSLAASLYAPPASPAGPTTQATDAAAPGGPVDPPQADGAPPADKSVPADESAAPTGSDVSPELAAYRATTNRRLYGAEGLASVLPDDALDAVVGRTTDEGVEITREMAAASIQAMREAAADLSLGRAEIAVIARAKPPTDIPAAHDRAVEFLNADHGTQAATALRAARAYVQANPTVHAFLERAGLGNNPEVVRLLAARALELVNRGHLTITKGKA